MVAGMFIASEVSMSDDEAVDSLGWGDPIQHLQALQEAMGHLRSLGTRASRLDRATSCLSTYGPLEFPERIRQRAVNIHEARQAVRRDYGPNSLFHFSDLGRSQQLGLENDIEALFMACLIDIGRMERHAGLENEWANFSYPGPGKPLDTKLSAKRGEAK